MSTRYSGFKAASGAHLSMEPGTSDELRRDRFLVLSQSMKAPPAIDSELAATGKSVAAVDASTVKPGDYHPPSAAGSMAATRMARRPPPRRTMARSSYATEFPDFQADAAAVVGVENAALHAAFEHTDSDGSGYIEARELPELLRRLLGREPSMSHTKAAMCVFDRNRDGRISIEELEEGWPRVVKIVTAQARVTGEKAKPVFKKDQGPQVLGSGALKSTNHTDFGGRHERPDLRPAVDESRHAMSGTTDDLAEGTTKGTRHTAGYMGFTAAYHGHSVAKTQSFGREPRDTFAAKTNLLQTMGKTTGYTGHVPQGRTLVKDPEATDMGSANKLVEAYWAARAARNRDVASS